MGRPPAVPLIRLVVGLVLGVLGFGTVSLGVVHLSEASIALGIGEIAVGGFVALGVLTPLRRPGGRRGRRSNTL